METTKCKLIEYDGKFYLILSEKREIKTGDRVLTCYIPALQTITGPAGGWDHEGLYTTNHTPACIYVYGKSLDIVVACEEEIQKADLLKLKKEINCSIYTHNGEPCFIKNKILIIN
ncbi:MAG TPA: hypothetical protein PLC59_08245 [Bacteroidales bacterium]|nr:hypothetical protein [Bacteroidales bacterium]HQI46033.1 hypothetical protein [Bacteroidales bacterium]